MDVDGHELQLELDVVGVHVEPEEQMDVIDAASVGSDCATLQGYAVSRMCKQINSG